jgi:hypothetical protein
MEALLPAAAAGVLGGDTESISLRWVSGAPAWPPVSAYLRPCQLPHPAFVLAWRFPAA